MYLFVRASKVVPLHCGSGTNSSRRSGCRPTLPTTECCLGSSCCNLCAHSVSIRGPVKLPALAWIFRIFRPDPPALLRDVHQVSVPSSLPALRWPAPLWTLPFGLDPNLVASNHRLRSTTSHRSIMMHLKPVHPPAGSHRPARMLDVRGARRAHPLVRTGGERTCVLIGRRQKHGQPQSSSQSHVSSRAKLPGCRRTMR